MTRCSTARHQCAPDGPVATERSAVGVRVGTKTCVIALQQAALRCQCYLMCCAATCCTLLRRVVLCCNVLCCAATCCTVRGRGGADHQHLEDLREQLVHLLDRRPPRRLDAEDAFKDGPFLVLRSTVPRDVARCNMTVQHVATACKVDLGPTNVEEWARLRDFDQAVPERAPIRTCSACRSVASSRCSWLYLPRHRSCGPDARPKTAGLRTMHRTRAASSASPSVVNPTPVIC
jgi:hypothetical protein